MTARNCQYESERDAQDGSRRLLDAMNLQFFKLATSRRGVTVEDARLLLMNGEKL